MGVQLVAGEIIVAGAKNCPAAGVGGRNHQVNLATIAGDQAPSDQVSAFGTPRRTAVALVLAGHDVGAVGIGDGDLAIAKRKSETVGRFGSRSLSAPLLSKHERRGGRRGEDFVDVVFVFVNLSFSLRLNGSGVPQ